MRLQGAGRKGQLHRSRYLAAINKWFAEKHADEHFSVDGTQIQAWASMKSFVAKGGSSEPPSSGRNGERDFHGEKRRNETHASTTEPEAKLYKKGKGKEAKLSYIGNVMTENRNGFVVEAELRPVSGSVEREAAAAMILRHLPGAQRITVGADKAFDTTDFVADMRALNVTPHVAQNTTGRRSAIDGRTAMPATRQASRSVSESRSRSAGARPSAAWPAPCYAASRSWTSSSSGRWPPTISSGCQD